MPQRVRKCTKPGGNNASYPSSVQGGPAHSHPQRITRVGSGEVITAVCEIAIEGSSGGFSDGKIALLAALAVDAKE